MLLKINDNLYINPDEIVSIIKHEEKKPIVEEKTPTYESFNEVEITYKKEVSYFIFTRDGNSFNEKEVNPRVFEYLEC